MNFIHFFSVMGDNVTKLCHFLYSEVHKVHFLFDIRGFFHEMSI